MNKFDFIDVIAEGCKDRCWHFCLGEFKMINYEVSNLDFDAGQIVVGVHITKGTPEVNISKLVSNTVEGFMLFGRKVDPNGTVCDLTETQYQKYCRRGKELIELGIATMPLMLCEAGWEMERMEYESVVNKFDTNIDFVLFDFRFSK